MLPALWIRGSSPLTRGAQGQRPAAHNVRGLIPAHAGSTAQKCRHDSTSTAHPRSRGEHDQDFDALSDEMGSSPLTRGAPNVPRVHRAGERLIPAHAGSTFLLPAASSPPRAHPRSRGEHQATTQNAVGAVGSSPLTRGAPFCGTGVGLVGGLIPAHAGSTYRPRSPAGYSSAHPRSRGEHEPTAAVGDFGDGSSPLTRGAQVDVLRYLQVIRLIPAHAGSTPIWVFRYHTAPAHPRSRGEHRR